MSAPRHDREPGARRKAYSKPKNARRDAALSARAALALTWVPPGMSYRQRRALVKFLDSKMVQFAHAGERAAAADMQELRRDVLASWNTPVIPSVTLTVVREETAT